MRGKQILCGLVAAALLLGSGTAAEGQQKARPKVNQSTDELAAVPANDREATFYPIVDIPSAPGAVVEAGSFAQMPDGRLAIGTRRGEVLLV